MRSLIDEIVYSVLTPALKKRLLRSPYVPFQRYLGCYEEAFEAGVVLGYAFRNNTTLFAKLFSMPGRERELVTYMQQLAADRLKGLQKPSAFFDLAMFPEEKRITANWRESGIDEAQQEYLKRRMKLAPKQAFGNLHVAVSVGIGFGSKFPDETERLWKMVYERRIGAAEWEKWKGVGLDLPPDIPPPLSLANRQEQLLVMLRSFVNKHRPELSLEFGA